MPVDLLEIMLPLSNRFLGQENTNISTTFWYVKNYGGDQSTLQSSVWGEKQSSSGNPKILPGIRRIGKF